MPSAVTGGSGSGWGISGFDQRLVANADGSVTYDGPAGLTGVCTPGVTAGSGSTLTFTAAGRLTSVKDRNANLTTFTYTSTGLPASVVSSRGAAAARTVTVGTSSGRVTSLAQTSGALTRTVSLRHSSLGHLASVTDSAGGVTRFAGVSGADSEQLVSVTNPAGAATSLTYSGIKATEGVQSNTATGSPGASVTRLSYPSATQTVVADPTTDQTQAVSVVPHTTYALTGGQLVSSATDPDGHARSATYTSLSNLATSTPAAGGATTSTYGANGGESLTSVASPAGATSSAAYTNTGASQYLPSSRTGDDGNATKYTYNGAGNQLSTAQGTGPAASVTYNTDGTPATSASPGAAAGVQTAFGYDSTHQLTSTTAPSGSSLGARAYTWDGFGRDRDRDRRPGQHDHLHLRRGGADHPGRLLRCRHPRRLALRVGHPRRRRTTRLLASHTRRGLSRPTTDATGGPVSPWGEKGRPESGTHRLGRPRVRG